MNEIVFYNGFNLLVDIALALAVGFATYYFTARHWYIKGYSHGTQDEYRIHWSDKGIR